MRRKYILLGKNKREIVVAWDWQQREGWAAKEYKKILGMIETFCILFMAVVSRAYVSLSFIKSYAKMSEVYCT